MMIQLIVNVEKAETSSCTLRECSFFIIPGSKTCRSLLPVALNVAKVTNKKQTCRDIPHNPTNTLHFQSFPFFFCDEVLILRDLTT